MDRYIVRFKSIPAHLTYSFLAGANQPPCLVCDHASRHQHTVNHHATAPTVVIQARTHAAPPPKRLTQPIYWHCQPCPSFLLCPQYELADPMSTTTSSSYSSSSFPAPLVLDVVQDLGAPGKAPPEPAGYTLQHVLEYSGEADYFCGLAPDESILPDDPRALGTETGDLTAAMRALSQEPSDGTVVSPLAPVHPPADVEVRRILSETFSEFRLPGSGAGAGGSSSPDTEEKIQEEQELHPRCKYHDMSMVLLRAIRLQHHECDCRGFAGFHMSDCVTACTAHIQLVFHLAAGGTHGHKIGTMFLQRHGLSGAAGVTQSQRRCVVVKCNTEHPDGPVLHLWSNPRGACAARCSCNDKPETHVPEAAPAPGSPSKRKSDGASRGGKRSKGHDIGNLRRGGEHDWRHPLWTAAAVFIAVITSHAFGVPLPFDFVGMAPAASVAVLAALLVFVCMGGATSWKNRCGVAVTAVVAALAFVLSGGVPQQL